MRRNICADRARGLGFESLEKREVMAGNVTAAIVGGSLVISGDDNNNNIEVVGTGVAGEYRIIGHELTGATLINGAAGPATIRGVTGGILINLRGGHDRVAAHSLTTFGDLNIQGGAGVDRIVVGDPGGSNATRIGVNLVITDLEDGGTSAHVLGTIVGNNATIDLGGHWNQVTISSAHPLAARVGGDVAIRGVRSGTIYELECRNLLVAGNLSSPENDDLLLSGVRAAGNISVYTYAGNDQVAIYVTSAATLNVVTSALSLGGRTFAEDNDAVYLTNCQIGESLVVTGSGYDAIEVFGHRQGALGVYSGSEWDHVNIRNSDVDNFYADLGEGGDTMYFIHSRVWGWMGVFGGNGDDYFNEWGTNLLGGPYSVIDFERRD